MATNLMNKSLGKLSALFELRSMLREMEHEVGLDALTPVEMDVFLAAHALSGSPEEVVTSDEIRKHDLTAGIAQASERAGDGDIDPGVITTVKFQKLVDLDRLASIADE